MVENFFTGVLAIIAFIVGSALLTLYVRNIYKIYVDIQNSTYSVMTVVRCFGIPFFFLGIILGFV